MVLPTRGMVDFECKIGKIKVIMRKVVICALDLNVLSSYSVHSLLIPFPFKNH